MRLYRIAHSLYIHDQSGEGARLTGGRWNHRGTPVLYTAGSIALAAWEVRVHLPNHILPRSDAFALASFTIPNECFTSIGSLGSTWKSDIAYTKNLGERWVSDSIFLCLRVPSAIIDGEYNYLINPKHPDAARKQLESLKPFIFDSRTFF